MNIDAYLVVGVILLFVILLAFNIYFRIKVLRSYKYMNQNDIHFGIKQLFDKEKMEKEVYAYYPEHREEIETFVFNLKRSINIAVFLILLIALFGAILMYLNG